MTQRHLTIDKKFSLNEFSQSNPQLPCHASRHVLYVYVLLYA